MTVNAIPLRFQHTVHQKAAPDGKPLSIWTWSLRHGGRTVASGERTSEQEAWLAAQAAELNYGSGLDALQSDDVGQGNPSPDTPTLISPAPRPMV